jgi:outer membrane protein assembly factor BamB
VIHVRPVRFRLSLIGGLALALSASCSRPTRSENSGGWRGPQRQGIFPATGLLRSWPENGPPLAWEAAVGRGWSSACIADGRVFWCGSHDGTNGVMQAFDLDGRALWQTVYGPDASPRATPTVADGVVFQHTVAGVLVALDAATGQVRWRFDAATLGDTLLRNGGNSMSPLVSGDHVIIALRSPGGSQPDGDRVPSLVAVDRRTGQVAWQGNLGPCPVAKRGWSSAHASPIPVWAGKTPLIVNQFFRCVAAVRADTGEPVWREETGVKDTKRGTVQPVANDGYLFVFGSRMLKIQDDGTFQALWEGKIQVPEYNISYSHSLIRNGRLIAFTPDGAMNPTQPGYLRLLDCETGQELARCASGAKVSLAWADDRLYVLENRPRMVLLSVDADHLREVSAFAPPLRVYGSGDGVQLFTPPVIAAGRLWLRDNDRILVYDLRINQVRQDGAIQTGPEAAPTTAPASRATPRDP